VSGVVVAAHPDDEILWLSSVLAQADKIVLCFGAPYGNPKMAASRQRAVAALGLANLADLAIPEAGVRKLVDWAEPVLTATGMAIGDAEGQSRYDANFGPLLERLRPLLAGATAVYTHNPWGEYGHPEHVQVHRAVARLQTELGFTLWFSNYVAPLSLPLARQIGVRPCWAEQRLTSNWRSGCGGFICGTAPGPFRACIAGPQPKHFTRRRRVSGRTGALCTAKPCSTSPRCVGGSANTQHRADCFDGYRTRRCRRAP
jgi:hypothetical protein